MISTDGEGLRSDPSSSAQATVTVTEIRPGRVPIMDSSLARTVEFGVEEANAGMDGQLTVSVKALSAGRPYFVRVAAWNGVQAQYGPYTYLEQGIFRTLPSLQSPASVTARAVSDSDVEITWTAPGNAEAGGEVGASSVSQAVVDWDVNPGVQAVQRVTVVADHMQATAAITGATHLGTLSGFFTLSLDGYETHQIPYDATEFEFK